MREVDLDSPVGRRARLVDEIQDYIREAIYSGKFPPGTPLRQEPLAEMLDVSRTPLREALRVLESEGLITLRGGHAAEVVSTGLDEILDACLVREVLDGLAARLAAQSGSADPGAYEEILERQRAVLKRWDKHAFTKADAELHMAILGASGNRHLIAQAPLVRMTAQVFHPAMHYDRDRAEIALAGHEQIIDAILAADAARAEALAREHVGITIETVRLVLEDEQRAAP